MRIVGAAVGEEGAIHLLVGFGRLVASAGAPEEILDHLAAAMVEQVGARGAAVVRIRDDAEFEVVASRGMPAPVQGLRVEADTIDAELARAVLERAGIDAVHTQVLPLVAGRDLFGAAILLCDEDSRALEHNRDLAQGLADLAAVSLEQAERYAELARSHHELRQSREAMVRTEKLRSLGQMAAGVSHDLKNILNPLSLQLEVLHRKISRQDTTGALEAMGRMREVLRFGLETVERLRAFSRQLPERDAEPIELDRVAALAIDLSRARLGQHSNIALREELGAPAAVRGRPDELTTALVNLILNATEALTAGGTILVRTGNGDREGWVEVEDDGPGMAAEVQDRVFEPFFTTKSEGTGLGLAMVYAITHRQRGRVELDSEPGRGTRVRLVFPLEGPV